MGLNFIVVSIASPATAESVSIPSMINRSTSASGIDLCRALTAAGKFDRAKSLCDWQRSRLDHDDDAFARWTALLSGVLIAQEIELGNIDQAAIDRAIAPIDQWESDHPDHPRRIFMDLAKRQIQRQAIEVQVAMAAVSRHDESIVNAALNEVVRLRLKFAGLAETIAEDIAGLETENFVANKVMIDDLKTARQRSLVASAAMSVVETELFAPGSDDQIASAADTEKLANETLIDLGAAKGATREIHRIRIKSMIIQDRIDEARNVFDKTMSNSGFTADQVALNAELMIAEKNFDGADRVLASVADTTAAIKLARLKLMLATDQLDEAARWIDVIGQQHGLYAKRRAEVIALDFGMSASPSKQSNGLLVNQAMQMIREGDHETASAILSRIAGQTTDAEEAIRIATAAAASLRKIDQDGKAAEVLIEVALLHPKSEAAGKLHLQGLMLKSSVPNQDSPQTQSGLIIGDLRQHLATWQTSTYGPARDWLVKLLQSRGEGLSAAIVQTQTPADLIDEAWSSQTYLAWRQAIRNADETSKASTRASEWLSNVNRNDATFKSTIDEIAALLIETSNLDRIAVPSPPNSPMQSLIRWRRGSNEAESTIAALIKSLSPDRMNDLRWRLFRDGDQDGSARGRIAKVLNAIMGNEENDIEKMRLLLWRGSTEQAIKLAEQITSSNADTEIIISTAKLLGDQSDNAAKQEAMKLWDHLGEGAAKKSELWHLAKLKAIRLLHDQGEVEQAAKRAKYLLITNPQMDNRRKQQYKSFTE